MYFIRKIIPNFVLGKIRDIVRLGYIPKIEDPKTFNEKIRNRMRYNNSSIFSICSDKIKVRDYVKSKGLDEILIPLIDVWPQGQNIDKDMITPPCVLKANHNSGPVFIVNNKEEITNSIVSNLNTQLKDNYGIVNGEKWYSNIIPQLFSEKLLIDDSGSIPEDYKFHVFNNKGNFDIIIQVDFDRFKNHARCIYDEELKILPFGILYPASNKKINPPKNFEKMKEYAKKLAEDFNYVRVDLYNVNGKIYFGELTFGHGAGLEPFYPHKFDLFMGQKWIMDSEGQY